MGTLSAGDAAFLLGLWFLLKLAFGAIFFSVGFVMGAAWVGPQDGGS